MAHGKTTTTWLCPKCGASTIRDTSPGMCPSCKRAPMRLHNIATEQPPRSPYAMTNADVSLARWLEDRNGIDNANAQGTLRSERRCFWCGAEFIDFEPQAFVAAIYREPLSFPVGASCEACAETMLADGSIRPLSPDETGRALPQQELNGVGVIEEPPVTASAEATTV